jgi:hypothetical protein
VPEYWWCTRTGAAIDAGYVNVRRRELAESARTAAARIRALELLGRHPRMFAGR